MQKKFNNLILSGIFLFISGCVGFQESLFDPNSLLSALRTTILLSSRTSSAPETPTFLAIKNNSILESGFIIGRASADSSVEVSLDDGEFTSAIGTLNWKFKLPTGSNSWRLGSLHKISIRATRDALMSPVTTISVRKGTNRDVNGDGFTDLIVGSPNANSNFGLVSIFHGSENGISATLSSQANTALFASALGRLGIATVSGDFNGDGYSDILTSAFIFTVAGNANAGRAYILYGSESGVPSTLDNPGNVIIDGSSVGGYLGRSLAAGDLNSDGYDEVIIGAYLQSGSNGNIYIVNGRSGSIPSGIDTALANTTLTGSASRLGESVQTADLNGDGITDLIGGAPFAQNTLAQQGRVFIFNGSTSGIPSGNESSANATITGTNIFGSKLGCSIGYGDLNGDNVHDLILSACGADTNGKVYIFNGSTSGISSANDTAANTIVSSTKTSALFGSSVRSADINDDGIQDLLVGSSAVSTNLGEAYIFYGSTNGITAANETSANAAFTGTNANGMLGFALTPFDYDSDSNTDLVIAATGGSGVLHFFRNSGTGIATGSDFNSNQKIQGGTGFGSSLVH
ncbi:FG-GAP-like repeat-containing protein [Leptospira sp. GIMC2001]|uniref:FG-GAP-like repeat-containing protein n=1 Tax=Leptospira sp. GIMC2001 TaxID=1513297 RepID=UPI00234B4B14|nr:FG-GAP-like repeat-containing protein [Leptospira sp. GIMC2001]WCL47741.1 FG-GAP-like repeat-containing protein [Leptospira sp. GIMC2001]